MKAFFRDTPPADFHDVIENLRSEGATEEEQALFVTLHMSVNYDRPTARLDSKTWGFWNTEPWIFHPESLVERGYGDLANLFTGMDEYQNHPIIEEDGKMRYGKQDAGYWFTVAYNLREEYDSNPLQLLSDHNNDAVEIYEYVKTARGDEPVAPEIDITKKYPGLGAKKIGPLWLRAMHENFQRLENFVELPFPVDIQIAKVTNFLFDTEYSADDSADQDKIREIYREFAREHDKIRLRVDKPIWLIGKMWNDGGKEYIHEKIEES